MTPATSRRLRVSSSLTKRGEIRDDFTSRVDGDCGTSIAQNCHEISRAKAADRQQETGILSPHPMRRLILSSVVVLLLAPALASAQDKDRGKSKEQVEFGIKVAQNNLWNEALYRWQKATELDPNYAAAWNNLAIAYEHEGKFDDAKKAYEKALQLEPKNLMIRQNYDLFKEINDRTKRRSGK
jgi:tetratricopeptide (TPR) repeat protein